MLYFGCRSKDQDLLYWDEFSKHLSTGALSTLHVAFSREEAPLRKTYVQDALREDAQSVAELVLVRRASMYVCGDGVTLAVGVRQALEDCLAAEWNKYISGSGSGSNTNEKAGDEQQQQQQQQQHDDQSQQQSQQQMTDADRKKLAVAYVQGMIKEGRFVTDIWS